MSKSNINDIRKRIFGGKRSEDNFISALMGLMREFGLSYKEVLDIPIPTFKIMMNELNKENKKRKRKMRKAKRGR